MLDELLESWKVLHGTTFFVLGLLLGGVVWAVGLGRGFDQGFDQGIQILETGQVLVESTQGGFDQYFRLRSLIEGIPGVVAASARLEFSMKVTNPQGKSKTVPVRAFSFAQEDKVTSFHSRILHGISGPLSGLLIPKSWEDQAFLFPSETAGLTSTDGTWSSGTAVVGSMERTSVFLGPDTVLLDLETAQSLLGARARVTSFAVRLAGGLDPDRWIKEHGEAFLGFGVQLKSWKVASKEFRARVLGAAVPLFILRDVVILAIACGLLGLVWQHRLSRLWFLPAVPRSFVEGLLALGCFAGTLLLTVWLLWSLFPFWEMLFIDRFKASYPFTGPAVLAWGWDWGMLALPAAFLLLGIFVQKRVPR